MSAINSVDLHSVPLYFVFERKSMNEEQFKGTFHAHQGVEILMIHEGNGTLIVDQKSYEIKSGLICIFQPYTLHNIQMNISEDVPFVRSIVHYEPSLYETYFEKWPSLQSFFKYIHKGNLSASFWCDQMEMESLASILFSLDKNIHALSKDLYFEEFSLFLVSFFRTFKQIWESNSLSLFDQQERRKPHQVERIMEWLDKKFKEPLRLENMSRDLHLSAHHLSHLFKDCTGSSISDYLTAKRMQQALLLLMSGDYSVARISEEVGINNCSHFIKLFKNHFGSTPLQYRKQWLSNLKQYR
ncbi:AraC family transcriptional regulator [Paenibacillus endoradicis]|uniref:AraC family transcriptional regulator n=1 Tax=Paenibacillus endoradicis TaxID=2972487 RepID=UPI002159A271|nr:AraC family transcriptional regulator [Paenibacillus endoradicis]MCR8656999.1 AraC family transcriptional regulator [Paenibacillus endoradicis]